MSFQTWVRQPTTITGIASLIGAAACVIGHVLTGDTTVATGAGVLTFAAVHLVVDDNTEAAAVQTLVIDGVNAAVSGHLRDNLPTLLKDAVAVATVMSENPPAVVNPINQPATALTPDLAPGGGAIAQALGMALLAVALLSLAACANMTPAQNAAEGAALACVVSTEPQIAAEAASSDSDAIKAEKSALIAATTTPCVNAVQDGIQAIPGAAPAPTPAVVPPAAAPPAQAPSSAADTPSKVASR